AERQKAPDPVTELGERSVLLGADPHGRPIYRVTIYLPRRTADLPPQRRSGALAVVRAEAELELPGVDGELQIERRGAEGRVRGARAGHLSGLDVEASGNLAVALERARLDLAGERPGRAHRDRRPFDVTLDRALNDDRTRRGERAFEARSLFDE